MNRWAAKIFTAFFFLLCFTVGQIVVFSHSHVKSYLTTTSSKHNIPANADENCKICHLSHDATALLNTDLPSIVIYGTIYKQIQAASPSYQSISLVLAATRGPPIA